MGYSHIYTYAQLVRIYIHHITFYSDTYFSRVDAHQSTTLDTRTQNRFAVTSGRYVAVRAQIRADFRQSLPASTNVRLRFVPINLCMYDLRRLRHLQDKSSDIKVPNNTHPPVVKPFQNIYTYFYSTYNTYINHITLLYITQLIV